MKNNYKIFYKELILYIIILYVFIFKIKKYLKLYLFFKIKIEN